MNIPPSPDRQRDAVERDLLPRLELDPTEPTNPVVVLFVPSPWSIVGAGNSAAVFAHPDFPGRVVKVYAPGCEGCAEEIEVYRRLGEHPSFSYCFGSGDNYLILKRFHGVTFYDCLPRGIEIPPIAIDDIDRALGYARDRGLQPHDVHGRNVMVQDGRGVVVDVSDFLDDGLEGNSWRDLKRGYRWIYRPFFAWLPVRVPYFVLNGVRKLHFKLRRS